jgi:hypothetical protein
MGQKIEDKDIKKMLGRSAMSQYHIGTRRIDVFSTTSYDSEHHRAWFFYVEGSPCKALGFIKKEYNGLKMTVSVLGGKAKSFYFTNDFYKTTYKNLMLGVEPRVKLIDKQCQESWDKLRL